MSDRSMEPHISPVTIRLPNNNVPEIVRITVYSPTGSKLKFSCMWDSATDRMSGPWVTRESIPSRLHSS